ncbi:conserved membrane protein of unknown function [Methylacidimicrobium sp. AP8]|uniref:DUF4013 domain-containing protein n=1 Tax=Methylacidimicrobium sp. AP8 TaxID=2730359 RepID=UPI0018C02BCC|nr:DUF4013 domain-containing protein [Methylacidimicrobium sp. AP8]CAB4243526.1 conserved membrane protein of unknown function [Methylacidimicrobium sp. AP8]
MHRHAVDLSREQGDSGYFFRDIRAGFAKIFADRFWFPKIFLGGFLLINPILLSLAPKAGGWLAQHKTLAVSLLAVNVSSFWFSLGFTFEVLRRARFGGRQLPEWNFHVLGQYLREGAVKFVISLTTLLLPLVLWIAFCHGLFIRLLGLSPQLLSLFVPLGSWLAVPFCAVACCRWLDGASVFACALDYRENLRIFWKHRGDFLIASAFLGGLNAILMSLFYTIPFALFFGLCLVDTWFGPIYASAVETGSASVAPADSGAS